MTDLTPRAFCQAVMHEYERQWARASGHQVRHPLRLKIDCLAAWCDDEVTAPAFEARLGAATSGNDAGAALLAEELLPLWREVTAGRPLPFRDQP